MAHIIFLVGSYYPYFSAVGTCCYNIAEEITKQHKVTVVCMKSRSDQIESEEYKGQTIVRVSHSWWDIRLKLDEKVNNSKGIMKKSYTLLLNAVRAKEYLQTIFSGVSLRKGAVSAYLSALENLTDPVDVLIPVCFPMEAVVAGERYILKYTQTVMIPFLFDPFVDSHTLHRTDWNRRLKRKSNTKLETQMLHISSKVFCVNQLKKHFLEFEKYKDKIIFTEHPMLKRLYDNDMLIRLYKGNMHLTYAGVFDKTIRNPEYFMKVMLYILPQMDALLHLYTHGNCMDILENYTALSMGTIIDHGFVPKEEANIAIYSSDVLVCVGNVDNLQVPSKIFEYMSTGKPIVHFYTIDDDVNVKILKDYPLCLCLKQDDHLLRENAQKFIRFCQENKDRKIGFSEVEKIYYYATPKFIANQIMEIIDQGEIRWI